ncbi:putative transposon Ty3-I Gag-Pol polyprotein [Apostichopus japonicus]|uniref:Putative transposon Ty3-I Gag-Pol polyprotein n=3 Tax=Stichopus japonicus TaxID=307972 RepID=A0A2G8KAP7_STIJA|nr:putative transposon Ty3-I Gag-Pol polyprotein [Apostichopus japonicus]
MAEVCLQNRTVDVGFLVLPSELPLEGRRKDYPILLGCNALKKLAAIAAIDGEETDPGFQILLEGTSVPIKLQSTDVSFAPADISTGSSKEVIAPYSARRVECRFKSKETEGGTWLVSGLRSTEWEVVEGCITPENQTVSLLIANPGAQIVCIPPNYRVAEAVPARPRSEVFTSLRVDHIEVDVQEIYDVDVEGAESEVKCTSPEVNKREKFQFPDGSSFLLPIGLSLKGLDTDQAIKVALLVKDNLEAFSNGDFDLGFCDAIPHEMKLQENTPIRQPYRRIPPNQLEEVKDLLQDMLDKKIIKKSSSPYASPIVLVRKKFGGIRLCIDYRKINEITLKDSFPLPRIEETLEVLGGAKFFSSLDLAHGYFQVAMKEEDIPKTAFRVPWGSTSSIGCRKGSAIAPVHFRGLWN